MAQAVVLNARDLLPLKRIASGTYGTVVLCRHCHEDDESSPVSLYDTTNLVVLKLIDKNRLNTPQRVERIDNELRVLRDVSPGCPFLISGMGYYQTSNAIMFALQYSEGGDLLYYFQQHPQMYGETRQNRLILMQIAAGINHLHTYGVLWRDAKMENILITAQGKIKLCDFGLIKFLQPKHCSLSNLCEQPHTPTKRSLSHTSLLSFFSVASSSANFEEVEQWEPTHTQYCGTTYYLSPQSVSGKPYGLEHDWWGFGVLCYELCCGKLPFYAETTRATYKRILRNRPKMRQFKDKSTRMLISSLFCTQRHKRLGFGVSGFRKIQTHPFFTREGMWDSCLEQHPISLKRSSVNKLAEFFDPSECEFDSFSGRGRPDLILQGFDVLEESTFQRLRALS